MSLTRRQSKVKGQEKELKTTLPRANSKFARMEDKFSLVYEKTKTKSPGWPITQMNMEC